MFEEKAIVVPLIDSPEELTTEVMLRMILGGDALVIQESNSTSATEKSGLVAQTGGTFAKAVSQALGRNLGTSTKNLYRISTPSGQVAKDLVEAVGGGFRGMYRAPGSSRIAGHVTLAPVAGGAAAAAALGPLIATVSLAVAGEMLANHQMNKKLDSIKFGVRNLIDRADDQERATIDTALKQTQTVAGYLLDQAQIPPIAPAAHAFGNLDSLTSTYSNRLDRWTDVVNSQREKDRVYAPDLLSSLVGKSESPVFDFERKVAWTYEALALRARVVLLEKVASEQSNPQKSLAHVESVLSNELRSIAAKQRQLIELVEDLSILPIDSSKAPITFAGKGTLEARASFSRLARALHALPDGVPVLDSSGNTVLELAPSKAGLSVVSP